MKAIVLAAGQGSRLRPLTDDKPKGMVEVAGKPILSHCFDQLAELGADEFVVVVGYKKRLSSTTTAIRMKGFRSRTHTNGTQRVSHTPSSRSKTTSTTTSC